VQFKEFFLKQIGKTYKQLRSYLIRRWLSMLFNAVVDGGGNASVWVLERHGGCTCRHSDTQVSRGQKWGFRDERDSTLETARSPLYIEVGECRAVVWHTCAWRLRNHGKCNHREEIRGNVVKRRYNSFELVSVAPCTPSRRGLLRVNCQMWYCAWFVIGPKFSDR